MPKEISPDIFLRYVLPKETCSTERSTFSVALHAWTSTRITSSSISEGVRGRGEAKKRTFWLLSVNRSDSSSTKTERAIPEATAHVDSKKIPPLAASPPPLPQKDFWWVHFMHWSDCGEIALFEKTRRPLFYT